MGFGLGRTTRVKPQSTKFDNIVCHECDPTAAGGKQCCMEDEGRPLEIGLQGQVSNHLELRGSRARVVSVEEKARHERVRYGLRRRTRVNR